ncbi:hypothetical protein ER308_19260 [Egibacter rhizosphaerae]|uniref:Uncharacterized protein n=1 Tax=Egibacter rhizosphaerae TaxID=1670831 RepID=A0A411YJX1_9ACTN|nr:hypothetical protein [Egibacter rhizosphaerae]QBI21496.1 hypothetical protein ER308_19260 [Egibacter rhizosphaerae]
MIRRPFYALLGLGAGITLGVYAIRKFDEAQRKLAPEELGRSAAARAGTFGDRLRDALAEGRSVAASREAELRAAHRPRDPGA